MAGLARGLRRGARVLTSGAGGAAVSLVTDLDGGQVYVALANRRIAIEPVVGQVRDAISQEH